MADKPVGGDQTERTKKERGGEEGNGVMRLRIERCEDVRSERD